MEPITYSLIDGRGNSDRYYREVSTFAEAVLAEVDGRLGEALDGFCASAWRLPGCSRPATDSHHIRYRSRGGTDDEWNQISTCKPHHLLGIHREKLVIPLGPASPGRVRTLASGKLEITVDALTPIEDWVRELPALIAAAQGT